MIIIYSCLALLAVAAVGFRGRIVRLASVELRRLWLIWVALADQLLVISAIPDRHRTALTLAHYASYVLAGAFMWANRRLPGGPLIFAGAVLNLLAITANSGVMPASPRALAASGWVPRPGHFANSAAVAHPQLQLFGDVFATPRWLPGHDVFSVGDVLIVLGAAAFIWLTCRRPEPVAAVEATPPAASAEPAAALPDLPPAPLPYQRRSNYHSCRGAGVSRPPLSLATSPRHDRRI